MWLYIMPRTTSHPVCNRPAALARRQWIEARIQAAEEELEMPVVLEEFGSKLDKRCAHARRCPALTGHALNRV